MRSRLERSSQRASRPLRGDAVWYRGTYKTSFPFGAQCEPRAASTSCGSVPRVSNCYRLQDFCSRSGGPSRCALFSSAEDLCGCSRFLARGAVPHQFSPRERREAVLPGSNQRGHKRDHAPTRDSPDLDVGHNSTASSHARFDQRVIENGHSRQVGTMAVMAVSGRSARTPMDSRTTRRTHRQRFATDD
jgi:hypothetical protein